MLAFRVTVKVMVRVRVIMIGYDYIIFFNKFVQIVLGFPKIPFRISLVGTKPNITHCRKIVSNEKCNKSANIIEITVSPVPVDYFHLLVILL